VEEKKMIVNLIIDYGIPMSESEPNKYDWL
jgi:hypothetical protein